MSKAKFPIVVLISGNGSNLQAIINATASSLPIKIEAVISSKDEAFGLERATLAHIPTHVLSPNDFQTRNEYDLALAQCIQNYSPKLVVLAGFMRILGDQFLKKFTNCILNIHPSLLPKYPGINTHELALKEGAFEHGCSVHVVNENLDAGPIIAQAAVKVAEDDTVSSLKDKVHRTEHFLYPTVINWFAQGRIKMMGNSIFFDAVVLPHNGFRFVINGL